MACDAHPLHKCILDQPLTGLQAAENDVLLERAHDLLEARPGPPAIAHRSRPGDGAGQFQIRFQHGRPPRPGCEKKPGGPEALHRQATRFDRRRAAQFLSAAIANIIDIPGAKRKLR